jgi:UDP-GlcNAc:undecaprenyl-phosphate/decaprenyl-phosphate GlcNAc-1-phosphate transferase
MMSATGYPAIAVAGIISVFCAGSAFLTLIICSYAGTLGRAAQLIDRPDGLRKLHDAETPLIGGLALLVPSFAASIPYVIGIAPAPFMLVAIGAAMFMAIIGVADDRGGLSTRWRFAALIVACAAAFALEPLFVLHTLRLRGFGYDFAVPLDPVAAPVTALMLVGFVNAVNMADGMNGQLLGSVAIWCGFIAYYAGLGPGLPFIAMMCSALVAMVFNLRGRLFCGSAGAYGAALFIGLSSIAAYRLTTSDLSADMPVLWFWLPVLDCLRLMTGRMVAGRSPISGDRNHFHHILMGSMRLRYALPVYLILLGAPGVAAIVDKKSGAVVLVLAILCYTAIVGLRPVLRARTSTP